MKKYTQKYFKELVRLGLAYDLTNSDLCIEFIAKYCDKIGYSSGIYGINGGMIKNRENGKVYVFTARCTNLFKVF